MMKQLAACALVACFAIATSAMSNAATINLNIDSLDAVYNGMAGLAHDINTLSNANGGNQDPAEANPLDAATFTLDGVVKAQFMESDDIYGDMLIKNLPASITAPDIDSIPTPGPVTFAVGDNDLSFGFEWFLRDAGSTISSLALDFDSIVVTLTDTGAADPTLTISASTTQWSAFNLPAGLQFAPGTRLRFSYTSQNTAAAPVTGAEYTNILAMEGVVTISGESLIPEPTAAYLVLSSLGLAAVATRWRLG